MILLLHSGAGVRQVLSLESSGIRTAQKAEAIQTHSMVLSISSEAYPFRGIGPCRLCDCLAVSSIPAGMASALGLHKRTPVVLKHETSMRTWTLF